METSVDWSSETFNSLMWILKALAITAPIFAIIIALLLRYTLWGRQFWRITGGFFSGRDSWKVYLFLLVLVFFTLFGVRLSVLASYWSNDQYSSLQFGAQALAQGDSAALQAAKDGFWSAVVVFCVIAVIWVPRYLIEFFLGQWFDIRWRVWITERVTEDWLKGRAYYRSRFIDDTIDNPDQRIQQDTLDFVQTSRALSFGAMRAIVTVVSFTKILWDLSGPISIGGFELPRAIMFGLILFVLITTAVAFWIGRPLIKLNFLNERFNANFRYALVRLRDNAENVAFYRGEGQEHRVLMSRFREVIKNYWAIVFRLLKFQAWNNSVGQAAELFPLLLQSPRLFAGEITFGDISQTSRAFGAVHDSLSFFRESYDEFAAYRATVIRLHGLTVAGDESRKLPVLTASTLDDALELDKVGVRKPDGELLIGDLDLRLGAGDALVVKGVSGSGKTTLLRTLAEMWPYTEGEIKRPDVNETLFLSQIPYLPLGDLRTTIAYPAKPEDVSDETLREALDKVSLGHIANRLDEEEDWAKVLSPGEQQRVAFARILLIKPKLVFLDEATSAVDEGLEYALYKLVREEVPELILVSVAHRSTVDQHHTQKLELDGDGPWRLTPVTVDK
ncbi:ABC transporter ATP-binding protein/permease [Antrihabitans sp. NCIMB 15449]|uniref:ABC transporter ATP-binding protein/permease n=1 Tax=Antrihabitans spumae TaxID=3373370 RepID=A0ABW7JRV5_9NOCA